MTDFKVLGVIPARYAASRFPGKPLALIDGKPMVQRVYEIASGSSLLDNVLVATDDDRIAKVVKDFGGEIVMTRTDCATGMDRCAEVASSVHSEVVVDIQGDEPLIKSDLLDSLVEALFATPWASIATPIRRCRSLEEYYNRDCVKTVMARDGKILYFSRSPIPYRTDPVMEDVFLHVGVYAFRREVLLKLSKAPRGVLEKSESLEQLRALEEGVSILGMPCEGTFIGVDRPNDIGRVEAYLSRNEGGK